MSTNGFIESEHNRDSRGRFTFKGDAVHYDISDIIDECNEVKAEAKDKAKDYLLSFFEYVNDDICLDIILGVECALMWIGKYVDGLPKMSRLVDIAPCKDKKGYPILSAMNKETADTIYFCSACIEDFEKSGEKNDEDRLNGRLPVNVCRDNGMACIDYAFHEYGHYLLIWSRMHDKVTDVMKESADNGTIPSEYAKKDEDEFFAEIFVVYFQDKNKLTTRQRELVERVMRKANAVFKGIPCVRKGVLMAGLDETAYQEKDYGPIVEIIFRNMHAEYDVPLDYTIEDPDIREIKAYYDRGNMATEANIRDLKEFIKTCKDPDLIKEAKDELEIQKSLLGGIRY